MGLELGKIKIKRFADGEIYVQLQESVRGCDVYLVQPTCPPANENLMELLIMIDACRRASAKNITAVIPYFGYARADRKTQGRESIAAKLVANLITEAGADRVLACDLHSGQSMGYFDIPVDHVHGQPVILDYLASKAICSDDLVVVSPDVGGVARARAFAKKLSDAPLAIVDKRRHVHNVAEVMNLIGDVRGKVAVMVDDMIDTVGTIAKGAALLHQEGAREVYACSTHAVFSPPAIERLSSGLFQEVIITNTIPVAEENYFPQLTILSVANLLGETIWRVHDDCAGCPLWIDENSFAAAKSGTGLVIAVKKLQQESFQGHREWLAEVNYFEKFSHPHLVKLIGYCLEDEHRLLVYEFMPRGSLENHLFRRGSYFQPLSWYLRLRVSLEAAKGLAFLHNAETKVIYRDLKTSNILLDSPRMGRQVIKATCPQGSWELTDLQKIRTVKQDGKTMKLQIIRCIPW